MTNSKSKTPNFKYSWLYFLWFSALVQLYFVPIVPGTNPSFHPHLSCWVLHVVSRPHVAVLASGLQAKWSKVSSKMELIFRGHAFNHPYETKKPCGKKRMVVYMDCDVSRRQPPAFEMICRSVMREWETHGLSEINSPGCSPGSAPVIINNGPDE